MFLPIIFMFQSELSTVLLKSICPLYITLLYSTVFNVIILLVKFGLGKLLFCVNVKSVFTTNALLLILQISEPSKTTLIGLLILLEIVFKVILLTLFISN